jgi:hypothetical protein
VAVQGGMNVDTFDPVRFDNPVPLNEPRPARVNLYTRELLSAVLSLLAGLFALWLCLTIQGIMGLTGFDAFLAMSMAEKGIIAAAIALMITVAGFPLMLPWVLAFIAFDIFAPPKVVLSKWLLCPLPGALIGIAALWLDAVISCVVTGEPWTSLNVPLLSVASLPAAIAGAVTCFAGAATARVLLDRRV